MYLAIGGLEHDPDCLRVPIGITVKLPPISTASPARVVSLTRSGGLLGAGLVGLWFVLDAALASDRGLDLTDEGLYLLAADPPSRVAAWGTPWGWHTAPLFRLVGGDVASFRTLGAVILVAASAALAVAAASGRWRMPEHSVEPVTPIEMTLAGLSGALGGYLYYAGMLRTPSYNWVVVLGSVVAATGILLNLPPAHNRMPRLGVGLAAFGLFLTIPSKPTSPILIGLILGALIWRRVDFRVAVRHVLGLASATTMLVVLAVTLGMWPLYFHEVFLAALAMPTPSDGQTLTGALLGYAQIPNAILRTAPGAALAAVIVLVVRRVKPASMPARDRLKLVGGAAIFMGTLWIVLRALTTAVYEERALFLNSLIVGRDIVPLENYLDRAFRLWLVVASIVLALLAALAPVSRQRRWGLLLLLVGMAAFEGQVHQSVMLGGEGKGRFVLHGTTTAMLLLVAVALVALSERDPTIPNVSRPRELPRGVLGLVGSLVAIAFSTAFGSAHGPYSQTALAAAMLAAAGVAAAMSIDRRHSRFAPLFLLTSMLLVLSASVTADNWAKPYRTAPIVEHTSQIEVASRGAQLRLDPSTVHILNELREAAVQSGWGPGLPLLGIVDPWHSTLPWLLGARVPDSLMLTLGGRAALLDWNLERLDVDEFSDAWLLVSKSDPPSDLQLVLSEDHVTPVESAQKVAARLGRTFPDDYSLVYSAPSTVRDLNLWVELWQPR
jgi:hypothetical protein